jgi:hypothetical protein
MTEFKLAAGGEILLVGRGSVRRRGERVACLITRILQFDGADLKCANQGFTCKFKLPTPNSEEPLFLPLTMSDNTKKL